MTCTAGAVTTHVYKLNDMYDPDYSGGGHQPFSYDQWTGFYANWNVTSCVVDITFEPAGGMFVGYCPSRLATLSGATTLSGFMEQPGAVVEGSNASEIRSMNTKVFMQKIFGVERQKLYDDPDFTGSTTASPANPAYLHVMVVSSDEAATQTCYLTVRLQFMAKFTNPRLSSTS